jgi:hypothetical protein
MGRDGTHFRLILNFLHVGSVVTLLVNTTAREELSREADFFGLEDLVWALRMPKMDLSDYLSEEVLVTCASRRLNSARVLRIVPAGFDPHRGLVSLFCSDSGVQPLSLT